MMNFNNPGLYENETFTGIILSGDKILGWNKMKNKPFLTGKGLLIGLFS